jgi:transposase
MAGQRKSTQMKNQIFELRSQGTGIRETCRILKVTRNTVRSILRQEGQGILVDPKYTDVVEKHWKDTIPWNEVLGEAAKTYATIKQLYKEYAVDKTSYDSFLREIKKRSPDDLEKNARVRLVHKPGEKAFIDYCDGFDILDAKTGEIRKTHLFVGVLPFSSYTFGEFVYSQKKVSFMSSQERMFRFFGGVPKYITPDNLKSAVTKADHYDPDVNENYIYFANHYRFAVIPARPYTPRDKASVEAQIGVIQRQFFAEYRNYTFTSLTELNAMFRKYLENFNITIMKDHGVSRLDKFENEKSFLQTLPENSFEVAQYKTSVVHPDCHIQLLGNFYSVPFQLIGKSVRVKVTEKLIEVFHPETHLAVTVHARIQGEKRKFVTLDEHYPPHKMATARFDIAIAKRDAGFIGEQTLAVVTELFEGNFPLRFLRRVQGILRLKKKFSAEAIEWASKQARLFNNTRLNYITSCAEHYSTHGGRLRIVTAPKRDADHVHLHDPKTGGQ